MNPCLARLDQLRTELRQMDLAGMWVTNHSHVRYLTGFSGSAGILLVLPDHQHFLTDGRYREQAAQEIDHCEIHIDLPPDPGRTHSHSGLPGLAHRHGLLSGSLSLGYDDLNVSVAAFRTLEEIFPAVRWTPVSNLIDRLAMIKDEIELQILRGAISITDEAFSALIPDLQPGATERQIAARITTLVRQLGGDGDAFEPIVAAGPRGALPHAQPSDRAFAPGDFVILDFGARVAGYHADMTRTVCIGPAEDRHHQVYQAVLQAQLAGIGGIHDGAQAAGIDRICRSLLQDQGFGDAFNHSTGHGVGLEVHTPPRLSASSAEILKTNMVVTVEPGVYLPGWGGVRIEDDVLVTETGGVPLNTSPKEMLVTG
ncbi:M24 family metallopeptidase [Candidatus Neomarinimicrobiota bacterium]